MKAYCTLALLIVQLAACRDSSPTIPPYELVHFAHQPHELDSIIHLRPGDSSAIDPQPLPQPTDK